MENFHPIAQKIEDEIRKNGFWYERFEHEPVRTSEEAAQVRPEYALGQGTKSLIVKGKRPHEEKRFFMVVVPGDRQFDKNKLRAETDYGDVRFATPEEVGVLTGGIMPGGVPPFGNLFGLQVFADKTIFENEKIIFNAGDRRVSIGMHARDYRALVDPHVGEIT